MYDNNDPGLTMTYFMARSNLVPMAFDWKKLNKCIFCAFMLLRYVNAFSFNTYEVLEVKVI